MKLLFVSPYVPYPPNNGGKLRIFNLVRELGKRHDIFFYSHSYRPEDEDYLSIFRDFCAEVRFVPSRLNPWPPLRKRLFESRPLIFDHWYDPSAAKALHDFIELRVNEFDFIHISYMGMASYLLGRPLSVPAIVDRDRVDFSYYLNGYPARRSVREKIGQLEHLTKLYLFEKRAAKFFHQYVVCCKEDQIFIHRWINASIPVTVIPNGVDPNYFKPHNKTAPEEQGEILLFPGDMSYFPNVDGIAWFFSNVYPRLARVRPELKIYLAGQDPSPEVRKWQRLPNVFVTGSVPDIRPYYQRARLVIVPLRIGGGSRLKIPEAMAMERPVISTSVGCQGIDVRHGIDICIADTPEDFASEVINLLDNSTLRQRLVTKAREFVVEQYAWPRLVAQLSEVYERIREERDKVGTSLSPCG